MVRFLIGVALGLVAGFVLGVLGAQLNYEQRHASRGTDTVRVFSDGMWADVPAAPFVQERAAAGPAEVFRPNEPVPGGGAPEPGAVGPCAVTRVVDGDTVQVDCGARGSDRVRLLRVDTAERGEPGYHESSVALARMVEGREVYLVFEEPGVPERGGYGRVLAYLFVDGVNINVEMVRQGWSGFWTKYGEGRFAEQFVAAEAP